MKATDTRLEDAGRSYQVKGFYLAYSHAHLIFALPKNKG